jgi:hypothetical protein
VFVSNSKGSGNPAVAIHSQFVCKVFADSKTDDALFIDLGTSSIGNSLGCAQHVFPPFAAAGMIDLHMDLQYNSVLFPELVRQ